MGFHVLMIIDIFSAFDPASFLSVNNSTNILLLSSLLIISITQATFWAIPTRFNMFVAFTYIIIVTQLSRTFSNSLKGSTSIISTIFLSLIIVNLLGINPYTFSLTRHLIMTLSLGLPMWLSFILSSFIKDTKASIAHLLPDGAPDWLNPFLILIETTSVLVRPLTLSFRLAANISAGHIVLGLIRIYGAAACLIAILPFLSLLLTTLIYILFEFAICLIQAYIFCLLLSLYANDHAHFLLATMHVGFGPTRALRQEASGHMAR